MLLCLSLLFSFNYSFSIFLSLFLSLTLSLLNTHSHTHTQVITETREHIHQHIRTKIIHTVTIKKQVWIYTQNAQRSITALTKAHTSGERPTHTQTHSHTSTHRTNPESPASQVHSSLTLMDEIPTFLQHGGVKGLQSGTKADCIATT